MQIKQIFIWKVLPEDEFSNLRHKAALKNGLRFYKRYIESLRYITRLGQICASIEVNVNSQNTCLRLWNLTFAR